LSRIRISHSGAPIKAKLIIGGSKSISNRVLILNALSAKSSTISNLSDSDDTQTLLKLLKLKSGEYDAHHAGTTFRFMTAYLCLQEGTHILTGSDRMKQRPIGPLVDALRMIGAEIDFLEKDGYPPLRINGSLQQKEKSISIRADMSSQFLSALCMLAPSLPQGLEINKIVIKPQEYTSIPFTVESDWSSASYHYAIAAIADDAEIELEYYKEVSTQADSIIQTFCEQLGVTSRLESNTLSLKSSNKHNKQIEHDFITHPDIAQTIAAIAAAKNITVKYTGLKTLAIKETDRVAALQVELAKVGINIKKDESGQFEYLQSGQINIEDPVFDTYQDHRMAMALAPLALLAPVEIKNPKVVNKSYPNFWKDLETLGFVIEVIG